MSRRWWLMGGVVLGLIAVLAFVSSRRRRTDANEDVVPMDPRPQQELVDEASDQSFPASDPPSYWARGANPGG